MHTYKHSDPQQVLARAAEAISESETSDLSRLATCALVGAFVRFGIDSVVKPGVETTAEEFVDSLDVWIREGPTIRREFHRPLLRGLAGFPTPMRAVAFAATGDAAFADEVANYVAGRLQTTAESLDESAQLAAFHGSLNQSSRSAMVDYAMKCELQLGIFVAAAQAYRTPDSGSVSD